MTGEFFAGPRFVPGVHWIARSLLSQRARRWRQLAAARCIDSASTGGRLGRLIAIVLLLSQPLSHAQDANELARQQLEATKQLMEAQGMSAEEIQQMEAMYRQSMGPIVQAQAAREAEAQANFEAEHAERGKAVVSLPDKNIELQVTECTPTAGGDFRIRAQATRDSRSDSILIGGDSYYDRTVLQMFLKRVGEFDIRIEPMVSPESGRFTWTGTADGGHGPTEITVTVECGSGS